MLFNTNRGKRGFTITEILIAVLLVLILSAIAVPRLLGNQRQADDTSAKAQLRTAGEAARNLMYEAGGNFSTAKVDGVGVGLSRIAKDEPNIEFVASTTASEVKGNRRSVSVNVPANQYWIAASVGGADGTNVNCWYVLLDSTGGDKFAVQQTSPTGCKASDLSSTSTAWVPFDFPPRP